MTNTTTPAERLATAKRAARRLTEELKANAPRLSDALSAPIVLGTVSEAASKLQVDIADVWGMVAAGRLNATRADESSAFIITDGGPR